MEQQRIVFADTGDSSSLAATLMREVQAASPDRVFCLTDENTQRLCLPILIRNAHEIADAHIITIPAGDSSKTLDSVCHVWTELQQHGATRHSLLVCLGGGMVTDLGGFAASTFKRGIRFINIPTTLLAMVDASVGGKTGFNFGGLKNEIGVFSNAEAVIIDTQFLLTLDSENMLSGYAEMLKHGLIADRSMLAQLLRFDIAAPDLNKLLLMVRENIGVKQRIVTEDPHEQGIRKALNLGHTFGHAFESLAMQRSPLTSHFSPPTSHSPLLHGYAVAFGLCCELYLSVVKCGFPTDRMRQVVHFIDEHYGRMALSCDDYPTLLQLMQHDKKNQGHDINFTLLADVGDIRINQTATKQEIEEALDFFREGY